MSTTINFYPSSCPSSASECRGTYMITTEQEGRETSSHSYGEGVNASITICKGPDGNISGVDLRLAENQVRHYVLSGSAPLQPNENPDAQNFVGFVDENANGQKDPGEAVANITILYTNGNLAIVIAEEIR